MNKQEYLVELEKALKSANVSDSADILEEYAEHFDLKKLDGYGEEEIAAKLASPKEIAEQFGEIKPITKTKTVNRIISAIGLFFADIVFFPILISLFAWVIAFGAVALSFVIAGAFVIIGITSITSDGMILLPAMPFISSILLGITLISLAILTAMGAEYFRLFIVQITKIYIRWHKSVMGRPGLLSPLPKHPVMKPKKRRIMRNIVLLALIIFTISIIAAFISLMIAAGSPEFWHVWGWFV